MTNENIFNLHTCLSCACCCGLGWETRFNIQSLNASFWDWEQGKRIRWSLGGYSSTHHVEVDFPWKRIWEKYSHLSISKHRSKIPPRLLVILYRLWCRPPNITDYLTWGHDYCWWENPTMRDPRAPCMLGLGRYALLHRTEPNRHAYGALSVPVNLTCKCN